MKPHRFALCLFVGLAVVLGNPCTPTVGRLALGAESASESYTLEAKTVVRVVGRLSYDITYPEFRASEWVVCVSQAPTLPGQIKVRTTLVPAGTPAADESDMGRSLLMARVPADAEHVLNRMPITITYEATLRVSQAPTRPAIGTRPDPVARRARKPISPTAALSTSRHPNSATGSRATRSNAVRARGTSLLPVACSWG